jgi:hypothetical protein
MKHAGRLGRVACVIAPAINGAVMLHDLIHVVKADAVHQHGVSI